MFIGLINSFFIGFLLVDLFERRPAIINNLMISLSYNCIYYFGMCQLLLSKIINNINLIMINSFPLSNINNAQYKSKEEVDIVFRYRFNICSVIKEGEIKHKIIYWDDIFEEKHNKIEFSDIKLILIEARVNGDIYKIDLKTNTYDYYLVNNKFKKNFFIYYINKYINKDIVIDDSDKLSLRIIDQDANDVVLDFNDKNDSFELEKNGYKLNITDLNNN